MRYVRWPAIAAGLALVAGTVAVVGSLVLRGPAPDPSGRVVAASPRAPGLDKLDPASRALAAGLEPGEVVTVTLFTGTDERAVAMARRVREAGFEPGAAGGEVPHVSVAGPHEPLVALAAASLVTSASLDEVMTALRPVAAPLEAGRTVPLPGLAYAETGLPVDPATLAVPPNLRTQLLGGLAQAVTTIDGAPYADVVFEAGCSGEPDPVDCAIVLVGAAVRGSERVDRWGLHAGKDSGWIAAFDRTDPPTFGAVPRWLGREAERIARSDGATLEAIRRFDRIDGFAWNPAAPGVIEVAYARSCAGLDVQLASLSDGRLADDGVGCEEYLRVSVDVPGARVLGLG